MPGYQIFLRYSLVGLANTLFYGFLLYLALSFFSFSLPFSVALSYIIAMTFHYSANRIFTFNSTNLVGGELFRYLFAAAFNYLLTLIAVAFFVDILKISVPITSALSSLIVAISSFFMSRYWVFKRAEGDSKWK